MLLHRVCLFGPDMSKIFPSSIFPQSHSMTSPAPLTSTTTQQICQQDEFRRKHDSIWRLLATTGRNLRFFLRFRSPENTSCIFHCLGYGKIALNKILTENMRGPDKLTNNVCWSIQPASPGSDTWPLWLTFLRSCGRTAASWCGHRLTPGGSQVIWTIEIWHQHNWRLLETI